MMLHALVFPIFVRNTVGDIDAYTKIAVALLKVEDCAYHQSKEDKANKKNGCGCS
jgi:hypothetical protein